MSWMLWYYIGLIAGFYLGYVCFGKQSKKDNSK